MGWGSHVYLEMCDFGVGCVWLSMFWKNNPVTAVTHLVTILVSDRLQISNNKR